MNKFGAKEVTLIVDAVISILLFFVGKYAPLAIEDVKFLVVALQPVIAIYLGLVYSHDVQKLHELGI